jgi:hypothetical protein
MNYKVLLLLLIIGCGSCIYDDRSDCPQGINVNFYSLTECSVDTLHPVLQNVRLFVFDANGNLVAQQQNTETAIPAQGEGYLTVIAWAGLDADRYEIVQNVTSKKDLLFRLKRTAEQAVSIAGTIVYYGESDPVFLPDPTKSGSVFEHAAINMREITNRLTITVEGLPDAANYEIGIESRSTAMNVNSSIARDDLLHYASSTAINNGVLESKFTLLKLVTGYDNTIVVKNKQDGRELYRGDLLGTLLLKNPQVNLACDNDFTVKFTTKDQCQCGDYMIAQIWVNNWLVHSYDTDL